jgi:Cysteine-rich secretory protein family
VKHAPTARGPMTARGLMVAGMVGVVAFQSVVPASAANAAEESCFVSAINAARSSARVAPVGTNADLLGIARSWSGTMARAGRIFHNTGIANVAPSNWQSLGENVGVGPTCGDIAQALMASPEHRRNILDPSYTSVGVGVVDAAGGVMYVTEDFMGTAGTSPQVVQAHVPAPAPVRAVPAPAKAAPAPAPAPVKAAPATAPAAKAMAAPATAPIKAAPAPPPSPPVVPSAMPMMDQAPSVQALDAVRAAGLPRGILGGVVKALSAFFAR